jgi:hypothetical protein
MKLFCWPLSINNFSCTISVNFISSRRKYKMIICWVEVCHFTNLFHVIIMWHTYASLCCYSYEDQVNEINTVTQAGQRVEELPWQEHIHWTCNSTHELIFHALCVVKAVHHKISELQCKSFLCFSFKKWCCSSMSFDCSFVCVSNLVCEAVP